MEIPQANGWHRWLVSILIGGIVIPLASWTLQTTATNRADVEALQQRLERIERKLDRLLGIQEAQ